MTLWVTYFSPTTPGQASWSEDLSGAVRLGSIAGLIDEAELGAVGVSSLLFDDPDGTLGHSSDAITGLKQMEVNETACPAGNQRLWTGYIGDRHYRRGTDSLVLGVARKIDVTLADVNSFLSFRIFAPTALDPTSDFVRGAETDVARVAALLTTVDFLSATLFDLGYVESGGGVAMDACDYTGQHPADVLNDCAQASGRNFFVYYDETANKLGLFYHFDYAPVFDSALQISNVLADVDYTTTFAPEPDAELTRDPSRVVSAVYLPFTGGTAYRTEPTTAYAYAWRDSTAPSANVKTLTKANARADRYLVDNSTEDDRIICTLKVPRQYVTGIKAGQRILAKFSHLPGMEAFRWCRVLQRNVMANEETEALYNMRLELSPITPPPSLFAVMETHRAFFFSCSSPPTYPDGSEMVGWEKEDYTIVPLGTLDPARTGPVTLVPWATGGSSCNYQGFQVTADATVTLDIACGYSGVSFGTWTTTTQIRQNGTVIGSVTQSRYGSEGDIAYLTLTGVNAVAGDIFTVSVLPSNWELFAFGTVPYVWDQTHFYIYA